MSTTWQRILKPMNDPLNNETPLHEDTTFSFSAYFAAVLGRAPCLLSHERPELTKSSKSLIFKREPIKNVNKDEISACEMKKVSRFNNFSIDLPCSSTHFTSPHDWKCSILEKSMASLKRVLPQEFSLADNIILQLLFASGSLDPLSFHDLDNATMSRAIDEAIKEMITEDIYDADQFKKMAFAYIDEEAMNLENDSDFEKVCTQSYHKIVKNILSKFNEVHQKVKVYNINAVGKHFVEFAVQFGLAKEHLNTMIPLASSLLQQILEEIPVNEVFGDLNFLLKSYDIFLAELSTLKRDFDDDLKELTQHLLDTKKLREKLRAAYANFQNFHCGNFKVPQDEMDKLSGKTSFDESCVFQDKFTCESFNSTYITYLWYLEDENEYLKLLIDALNTNTSR